MNLTAGSTGRTVLRTSLRVAGQPGVIDTWASWKRFHVTAFSDAAPPQSDMKSQVWANETRFNTLPPDLHKHPARRIGNVSGAVQHF